VERAGAATGRSAPTTDVPAAAVTIWCSTRATRATVGCHATSSTERAAAPAAPEGIGAGGLRCCKCNATCATGANRPAAEDGRGQGEDPSRRQGRGVDEGAVRTPPGGKAGESMKVLAPDGQEHAVKIPPGKKGGDVWEVSVPVS